MKDSSNPTSNGSSYDAVVIGSGPNGFGAAITLARDGLSVLVIEGNDAIGGACRSAERTMPGFSHDICSAVFPLAVASPFFSGLPLSDYGLEWIYPPLAMAHPFDDGTAAVLSRSIETTADSLGRDAGAYRKLLSPFVSGWDKLSPYLLGNERFPSHPFTVMQFGLHAMRSATGLAGSLFGYQRARALFGGLGSHSVMPLERQFAAAFGLMFGVLGHISGWPVPKGGAQKVTDALDGYFRSLGGKLATGKFICSLDQMPPTGGAFFDVTPRQLLEIVGDRLDASQRRQLADFRYGPGVFKMDWALGSPIPWRAAECSRAGTVHIGGTLEEIALSERIVWEGGHPEKPFIVLAQPSLFDPARAPTGQHTAWAYCHVPNGSVFDMSGRIEDQVERFAPGFRDVILARRATPPAELQRENPNHVGGDITGGIQDAWQVATRPLTGNLPYFTPLKDVLICSSSTPPGAGVHGLCGHHAARAYLEQKQSLQRRRL